VSRFFRLSAASSAFHMNGKYSEHFFLNPVFSYNPANAERSKYTIGLGDIS
jgi:hypothetical protein